jgi:hypothetical protein
MNQTTCITGSRAALAAVFLAMTACGGPPKHVELAPARGDSYDCARAKVVALGLAIFEEDAATRTFQAIRSMTLIGADNSGAVVFDQLQVRMKGGDDAAGELEVTVTAGILQRGVIGGLTIGDSREPSSLSFVEPKGQAPTERGIRDAQAVIEASSGS